MTIFHDIRLIFAVIIVCSLAFGIKARSLFNDVNNTSQELTQVEEDEDAPINNISWDNATQIDLDRIEPAASDDMTEEKNMEDEEVSEPPSEIKNPLGEAPPVDIDKWSDASDTDIEYSGVQAELFEDLSQRRQDLEVKERELAMREALLQAAEREIDQKYSELDLLRQEIEGLLEKQSAEEEARINSLVKIYEGMKAKDAARIFNTLDIDVLISVVSRMSERKSAPVIASMNPERARTVTILLAEQKSLPNLSEQ